MDNGMVNKGRIHAKWF